MLKTQKLLLIRTDAGHQVGIGHLMRCLTMARFWKQIGGEVIFIVTYMSPSIKKLLDLYGFVFQEQDADPGSLVDANITSSLANNLNASWVIVDGYWFGCDFQKIIYFNSSSYRLMLIDPLGIPQHNYADLIVNGNIYANENYYQNRESCTQLLLGPEYILLRPEFSNLIPRSRNTSQKPQNILISFGGGDPYNLTEQVLHLLLDSTIECNCNAIVGPVNNNLSTLKKLAKNHPHQINIFQSPSNMHELMNQANIAILAGGSTVWEAMYMGVPCVLLSYAKNQLRVAPKLGQMGYALYSGNFHGSIPSKFREDVQLLLTNRVLCDKLSEMGKKLIDGKGNNRIIEMMINQI